MIDRQTLYIFLVACALSFGAMWHLSSPPPRVASTCKRSPTSAMPGENLPALNPIIDFVADNLNDVLALITVEGSAPEILYIGIAVETVAEARWAARDIARLLPRRNVTIACFVEKGCAVGKTYMLWESEELNSFVYCGPLYFALRYLMFNTPRVKFHIFLLDRHFVAGDEVGIPFLRTSSHHFYTGEGSLVIGHISWEAAFAAVTGNRTVMRTLDLPVVNALNNRPKYGIFFTTTVANMPCPLDELARSIEFAEWSHIDLSAYDAFNTVLAYEALPLGDEVRQRKGVVIKVLEGGSSDLRLERQIYISLAQLPQVNTICEIGFNAGQSAALWLRANPNATVYMFDLFEHKYGRHNEEFLRRKGKDHGLSDVPNRLITINGSSLDTVPRFRREHGNVACDLLSVDGGHFGDVPLQDMLNMREMANRDFHILVVDDSNCKSAYCTAVDNAIFQLEREAQVVVLARSSESFLVNAQSGVLLRGVTVMQYVFR
jgi:hypothetical protein